jgi:hypothetical protein
MIMAGTFLIIGQGIGTYANTNAYVVHNEDLNQYLDQKVSENNNVPLTESQIEESTSEYMEFIKRTPEDNIKLYNKMVFQWLAYPMLVSLLCFGLWKVLGDNNDEKTSNNA